MNYQPPPDKKDQINILKFFTGEYALKAEYVRFTEMTKPPILQPKEVPVSILVFSFHLVSVYNNSFGDKRKR